MYRLRFIYVMLKSLLTPKKTFLADFKLHFIAIPFIDTDVSQLFTQTYSLYMGLARWNILFNSEFRTAALKWYWVPVTASETMTYKKPIKAFSLVTLVTRAVYWDDQRFYLEHLFYVNQTIHAKAYVAGLVRGPKGKVKPNEGFKLLGIEKASPPMPLEIKSWIDFLANKNS